MTEDSIGNGAIKIACIQTVPGWELEVKADLEEACRNLEINRYHFLKGLGNFDIILLYAAEDFGVLLRKAGPIPNVLKSNLLLCYPYLSGDANDIYDLVMSKTFTGFCLLKISPGLRNYYPEIDQRFRDLVAQGKKNWSVLGTLGWNELIILASDNDIAEVVKELYSIGQLFLEEGRNRLSVIIKTLSFIGIHYGVLPPVGEINKGFKNTKFFLEKTPSLRNSVVNSQTSRIATMLEVTSKPVYVEKIRSFFAKKGFEVSDLVGKSDLLLQPSKEMAISHFLATLLDFRHRFKNKIFSTNTRISLTDTVEHPKNCKEIPANIPAYEFDYPELEETFGSDMASTFSNHFYTLNALFQNPLCGSVYADMSKYPEYIQSSGKSLKDGGRDYLNFAQGARKVLLAGAELRSYGTYETIEEVTGRFSEFRGGCQLALLSMEFLPAYVLEKLEIQWMGFIITGETKFFHINEVINVPNDALWNPQKWWALYHEIAHIIIDNVPDLVHYENPSIRQFLSNKDYPGFWFDLVIELTAEVVGFELGFFGNYDLFLKFLWEHLAAIDPYQRKRVPIATYAIRTFFTKIFEGHFRKYSNIEKVSKEDFTNFDFLYQKLIEHMDLIEKTIGGDLFANKHFIAGGNAKLFKELYPFALHLSKRISELNIRPDKRSLTLKNTKEVVKYLKDGRIWWKEILHPEAIIYHLLQTHLDFKTRIASILTFWNQQMLRFGEGFK